MDQKTIEQRAKEYCQRETNDVFRKEVEALLASNNVEELHERFYTELSFGTGGIRGVMGGGYNRMNTFMIQRASEGLARYITAAVSKGGSVAIAYDSRNNSKLFAQDAASVFAAHGLHVYLFEELRPTPELSFAVRELGASAGVVITASHNPKKYNGYKVYWNDGAQVVPPHDEAIIAEVGKVGSDIKRLDLAVAAKQGLVTMLDATMDAKFLDMSQSLSIRPEIFSKKDGFKVVYTPLQDTGWTLMQGLAQRLGIEVSIVADQTKPDGNFPTVVYPNPEEASALQMALDQAKKEGAQLVVGTDPDADRIGIAVAHEGNMALLNGNQHGVLLVDYMFSGLKEKGKLKGRYAFVNTIVTTELQRVVAKAYGAEVYQTLTGFKWIAAKMREWENSTGPAYIMGDEESYGFLIGTRVRDKDAISATMLTIEMAKYYHSKGLTLIDRLNQIFEEHGFYQEIQIAKEFEGSEGVAKIKKLMTYLRANPPKTLGTSEVASMRDINDGTTTDPASGKKQKDIDLPKSDVLQFVLKDGSIVSARPSGTEPKIKFYASVAAARGMALSEAEAAVRAKIESIRQSIEGLIGKALA